MTDPLVSVLVCCYNRRDFLGLTLNSVFEQDYPNIEVIVVDDGSEDGTDAMIRDQYGDRVRYFWQENQGVSAARNRAAAEARGELIAFQDDDDLMPPGRITALLAALRQFPQAAFATGDLAYIDNEGTLLGRRWMDGPMDAREPARLMPDGQQAILWPLVPAVPHTTLFQRADGEHIGWFDTEFRHAAEDADFLARLGEDRPIAYVREIVSLYRLGHTALTGNLIRTEAARIQLWLKHLDRIGSRKPDLRDRLFHRLLGAVLRLEGCRQKQVSDTDVDLDQLISTTLARIPANLRWRFAYQARIRMPLKRLLLPVRKSNSGVGLESSST